MNLALNWLCLLGLISGNEKQKSSHPVDLTHTTKTKNKLRTGAQKDRKDANAARKAK